MQQVKIGIVEDEIIIADSIQAVLKSMHYSVPEPCCDYDEAIKMLQTTQPDLVLLDINLAGSEMDGIAVARYIRENLDIPFIFLTANSDAGTLTKAKTVTPNAFLVKPFQREDLYASIEIALHNFYNAGKAVSNIENTEPPKPARQYIFIKEGTQFYKINLSEIIYLESDHVYVNVYTSTRKYLVRTSLQQYIEELDETVFVRIHRGYVVNIQKVDSVGPAYVSIGNKQLPVSRKYRDMMLGKL